jgi:hypothetical protein
MLVDYKYYKEITIDSSKIDENLTHFPLPIPLSSGTCSDIFDEVGSDYLKIAVTTDDGETQLYCEVEQWDAVNEKALLWVSRSDWTISSTSDTEIYIYYDSTASDNTTYVGQAGDNRGGKMFISSATTGFTNGNEPTLVTAEPYVEGSHETIFECSWNANSYSGDINSISTGNESDYGDELAIHTFYLDTPISITENEEFRFTFKRSWGRYTP